MTHPTLSADLPHQDVLWHAFEKMKKPTFDDDARYCFHVAYVRLQREAPKAMDAFWECFVKEHKEDFQQYIKHPWTQFQSNFNHFSHLKVSRLKKWSWAFQKSTSSCPIKKLLLELYLQRVDGMLYQQMFPVFLSLGMSNPVEWKAQLQAFPYVLQLNYVLNIWANQLNQKEEEVLMEELDRLISEGTLESILSLLASNNMREQIREDQWSILIQNILDYHPLSDEDNATHWEAFFLTLSEALQKNLGHKFFYPHWMGTLFQGNASPYTVHGHKIPMGNSPEGSWHERFLSAIYSEPKEEPLSQSPVSRMGLYAVLPPRGEKPSPSFRTVSSDGNDSDDELQFRLEL